MIEGGLVLVDAECVVKGSKAMSMVIVNKGHYPKERNASKGNALTENNVPETFDGSALT